MAISRGDSSRFASHRVSPSGRVPRSGKSRFRAALLSYTDGRPSQGSAADRGIRAWQLAPGLCIALRGRERRINHSSPLPDQRAFQSHRSLPSCFRHPRLPSAALPVRRHPPTAPYLHALQPRVAGWQQECDLPIWLLRPDRNAESPRQQGDRTHWIAAVRESQSPGVCCDEGDRAVPNPFENYLPASLSRSKKTQCSHYNVSSYSTSLSV